MNTDFIIATGDATLAGREARTALRRPEMLRARVETSVTSGMRPVADTRDDLLAGLGAARPVASGGDPQAQGFFAHELRNLVNVAILSFEVLKATGTGVAGSSGRVLQGSLLDLRALIDKSLGDVRLAHSLDSTQQILVAGFVDDLETAATLEAHAKGLGLVVPPVEAGVAIEGDRQVLIAVVRNLLQNAFKFTRPHSAVTLRVRATATRVLIEVEDECGGLPAGRADDLFRPFEQRGCDRTGLGLGLAFSQQAVEANHGRISARSVPGHGCVFVIDLPRSDVQVGSAMAPADPRPATGLCILEQPRSSSVPTLAA
jgi:signal transduction histidine kinase